jgi:branched-chain amino acid transport system permease protein
MISWSNFVSQLFNGLALGALLALISSGLTIIYGTLGVLNLAHGAMFMLGGYAGYVAYEATGSFIVAMIAGALFLLVVGVLIERIVIRPVENAPVLAVVVVFIGLLVILNSVAGWIFTYTIKSFPSPFPIDMPFGIRFISPHQLGSIAVTLVVLLLLYAFFRFTPLGLAMRAAAQNPVSSRLVGIRVGWMLALGWGLAAAIGAVAGMMVAPIVYLDPNMMGGILLYAFAAALVGGIDSPGGAVLGGLMVGVLENLLGAFVIGNEIKLVVALVLIIGVLVVRPSGFFGRVHVSRV